MHFADCELYGFDGSLLPGAHTTNTVSGQGCAWSWICLVTDVLAWAQPMSEDISFNLELKALIIVIRSCTDNPKNWKLKYSHEKLINL